LRVSVWIHHKDDSIVIDCGPDFRQQMLTSKCPKVDAILFTHEHSDHTAGLDDIRPFNFKQGNIPVYGHERVLDNLKNGLIIFLKLKINTQERPQLMLLRSSIINHFILGNFI